MQRKRRAHSGFTLIEVLVVLVIIGLMTSIVAVNYLGKVDEGAKTKVKTDLRNIEQALTLYRLDNFRYPTTEEGLQSLVPKYVTTLTKDPWKRDYLYANPGEHGGEFDVYTLGKDGAQGGEGIDADIGNWNVNETSQG